MVIEDAHSDVSSLGYFWRSGTGDGVHLGLSSSDQFFRCSSHQAQSAEEYRIRKEGIDGRPPGSEFRNEGQIQGDVAGRADSGAEHDFLLHAPGDEGVTQVRSHEIERYRPHQQKQKWARCQERMSEY